MIILAPLIDRGIGKSHLRSCDVINRFLLINHDVMVLNPRSARGAESVLLLVFQNNSKTVSGIDTKFSVPYSTSI